MPKVMLVEDDNNLREIYEARLAAEGYAIISAKDGEEALALAVKERPDLIISDVMMPKISGFDMLDILRSTPEVKNTKVIMMTALGQAEDRSRADKLGADRYLVKSQVTLEDVVKVAHEVLADDGGASTAPASAAPFTADPTAAAPVDITAAPSVTPTNVPVAEAPPEEQAQPPIPVADTPTTPVVVPDLPTPVLAPAPPPAEPAVAAPAAPAPEPTPSSAPEVVVTAPKVDEAPANNQAEAKESETATVEKQIQDFIANGGGAASQEQPQNTPTTTTIPVTVPSTDQDATDLTKAPVVVTSDDVNQTPAEPAAPVNQTEVSTSHQRVLQPTSNILSPTVDLNDLLAKEEAKSGAENPASTLGSDTVIQPTNASESGPSEPAGFSDKPAEDFDAPSGAPSNPNNPDRDTGAPDPNQVAL